MARFSIVFQTLSYKIQTFKYAWLGGNASPAVSSVQ